MWSIHYKGKITGNSRWFTRLAHLCLWLTLVPMSLVFWVSAYKNQTISRLVAYSTKSYLSIYNRNVSSWGGLSCWSCREYVETRIPWWSHNFILTVQTVMAQFGDPSIKPVLGFHLEQGTRKDSCGNCLLSATGAGILHPLLMPDAENNFTFKW